MYALDDKAFGAVLEDLARVFGKELTDEQRTLYWHALRDRPLQEIKESAARHIRYGKHMPRPVELRPKDDKPREPRNDGPFDAAQRVAHERLEFLRHNDPDEWTKQVTPKVYEVGRARGMTDAEIAYKLQRYRDGVLLDQAL